MFCKNTPKLSTVSVSQNSSSEMFTGFWIHLWIVCRPSIKFYTLAKSNLAGNFAIRVKRFDENHMVQNPTKYHYVIKVTNITRIKLISMSKHETNQIVIVPWSKKLQVVPTNKFARSFSFMSTYNFEVREWDKNSLSLLGKVDASLHIKIFYWSIQL